MCAWKRRPEARRFQCIPSVVAESRPQNVWVGLLARRCRACSAAASPSPADGRVVVRSSVLTHSGGTAPDLHRTSLLCPSRAPKQGLRYITTASQATNRCTRREYFHPALVPIPVSVRPVTLHPFPHRL